MSTDQQVDFKILFESAPGLYLIVDAHFTILAVSDAYLLATMTERQQITGKNLFEVFPDNPDDPVTTGETNLRASLNFVCEHLKPHTMAVQKYDIRRPDGTFEERYWSPFNKPVIDKGELVYIIHRVEDVTEFMKRQKAVQKLSEHVSEMEHELYARAQEIQAINQQLLHEIEDRRNAERRLNESQMILQATMESHKNVLIFSIDRNYRYLNFNKTFKLSTEQAYGTSVEIAGNLLDNFTNELDKVKAKANCDRALAGESHITIEAYGDVNRFYFETRYDPIADDDGKIFGVTVLSANVTERILSDERITNLNKELDSFTYSVAHDLRAPLRVIDGYSQILQDEYKKALDGEGTRLLSVIAANARQMGELIDDLLSFSRLGKLPVNFQHVDMKTLVSQVIDEQLTFADRKNIEFRMGTLDHATCDNSLMRHVFSNLISNAIKYSGKKERSFIEIGCEEKVEEIIFYVKDNGSGFDMQYADKLFGVFQRLHKMSDFEGTGVGLAIVQRIILKHGGRVWAEAEVEKGATFYFSLPVRTERVSV
jgi:signal transduction histidine kinase